MGNALLSLASWFGRRKRALPWRDAPTIYRVWISEIMLQQTQVVTVIPYFEKFMGRFPSVEILAQAPLEDVLMHWAGLGYYSRARNLHRAAQMIVSAGGFPRSREEWVAIPGVGEYTAGAILSIAQGQPEAILDGNVERVLSRLRRVGRTRGDAAYKDRLWRLSRAAVGEAHRLGISPSDFNQALMELGATVCTFRAPKCEVCPVAHACRARAMGTPEAFPPKKKKKVWLVVQEELHCVIREKDGRVLLRQREDGEWRKGLWDLTSEAPSGARLLGEVETRYVVTRHKVSRRTQVWRAPTWGAAETGAGRWVSLDMPEVPVGSPLRKTWKSIRERFY
ncbi:MAG: A/G-specific adenine glycosylase [Bdellovibrionota bacterium]